MRGGGYTRQRGPRQSQPRESKQPRKGQTEVKERQQPLETAQQLKERKMKAEIVKGEVCEIKNSSLKLD